MKVIENSDKSLSCSKRSEVSFGSLFFMLLLVLMQLPGLHARDGEAKSEGRSDQEQVKVDPRKLDMVPDGNYLVNIEKRDGEKKLLNYRVKGGVVECVNSSSQDSVGLKGELSRVEPGVFRVFVSNDIHRATNYWHMREDGSADLKEVPDRGENQRAIPVGGDTLKYPDGVVVGDVEKEGKLDPAEVKIPDGFYLVEMEQERRTNLLNFEVTDGALQVVATELESAEGMGGRSMFIGNNVFMVQVRNRKHASTQFWVFGENGDATIREIPDRGEKHRVWKVKDGSVLERPKGK